MCRILGYLGPELPLEDLLLKPSNSLIKQSKSPRHHPLLQLAGWGFGAWSDSFQHPERPLVYRRPVPAFFDDNVNLLIPNLRAHTALAHIRAATYQSEAVLADENCHPFSFEGIPWILAHNGSLAHWRSLQRELLPHCEDKFLSQMKGTTDTEFLFVLFASLLQDQGPDGFQKAFEKLLTLILKAMRGLDLVKPSKLKLAFASQHQIISVNYGSGFKGETNIKGDLEELREAKVGSPDFLLSTILEPMYVLRGRQFQEHEGSYSMEVGGCEEASAAILASEPLTDSDDWEQLPFGSMLHLQNESGKLSCEMRELEI